MKNIFSIFLMLFVLPLSLFSCSKEEEDTEAPVEALFILDNRYQDLSIETKSSEVTNVDNGSIIVSMRSETWTGDPCQTKTSWSNSGTSVKWAENDQVGIYMRYSSGKFTSSNNFRYNITSEGSSSSPLSPNSSKITFPSPIATNNMKFYAYYPYAGVSSSTSPIKFANTAAMDSLLLNYTLPADQSSTTTLRNCDIMCATSTVANGTSPNVALPFNHKMTLLSFKINSTVLPQTLKKVTISGSAVTGSGTLNLINSTLTPNTSVTFSPYVNTSQATGLLVFAYVDIIINPCTITHNSNGAAIKVSLDFNGILGDHSTNLGITSGTLAPGTRYIYNLGVVL